MIVWPLKGRPNQITFQIPSWREGLFGVRLSTGPKANKLLAHLWTHPKGVLGLMIPPHFRGGKADGIRSDFWPNFDT